MSLLRNPRKVAVICLLFLLVWTIFFSLRQTFGTQIVNGSFTLYPEDTEVMENAPNSQSWYTNAQLQLANWTALEKRGYFKFNLSEAYRGALNVTGVQLMFHFAHFDFGTVGNEIDIYDTNNESWFDHNITWNNAPPLQYLEVYDSLHSSMAMWYTFFLSEGEGNTTFSMGGVQNAYNTNSTRTYVMAFPLMYSFMEWDTNESATYRPYMVVYYSQNLATEQETPRPNILQPTAYSLLFFADQDALVKSWSITENAGSENVSSVEGLVSSGYISILYLKFNLTRPDRVNNSPNSDNFTLTNVNFIATRIVFSIYCGYLPQDVMFRGYFITEGIPRENETSWNETSLTWSNKPSTRGYTSFQTYIDKEGYVSFDISLEENFIRYSIQNETTYSLVFETDQRASGNVYASFYTHEAELDIPYIGMDITTEPSALTVTVPLSWTNADEYLAVSWKLTPFIAGHFLSAMIYCVTVLPIGWIARKSHEKAKFVAMLLLVLSVIELTAFVLFTWLNGGIYVILLIILILFFGGVLKA